ncbi:hypothetical protein ACIBCT_35650 [Streptosporangium sp. NPDC050855]|uniref:hypothetical protein n=1 Tax=Streptosporangium sp. NPDC050855 TaxID=3366194 RepID=UPI00379F0167
MTNYANYLPNPSFETNTATWSSPDGASLSRGTANKQVGNNGLQIAVTTTSEQSKGMETTVPIDIGSGPFTLSGYVVARAAQQDPAANRITITVYDLLPGQSAAQRQQRATLQVVATGRWALRNIAPRAGADRLMVRIAVGNVYYQAAHSETTLMARSNSYSSSSAAYSFYNSLPNYLRRGAPYQQVTLWWVDYYEEVNTHYPAVDGGTASAWVDALQLEQGTVETAYVDGGFPGYTWSGTPHASATLGVATTQAHGDTFSTGSLGTYVVLLPELSGTAASTGRMEAVLVGMAGSGTGSSTGRLALWQFGPAAASGSADSSGSLDAYSVIYVGASGTAASDGSVALDITYPISLSGTGSSTGSVALTFPPELAGSGTAFSIGSLIAAIAGQSEGHGTGSSFGSLDLGQAIPVGGFADFAIFGANETDPLLSIRANSNGGVNTGANGAEWVRVYCDFVVPEDVATSSGTLWNRAAYLVPGIRFENVAATNWQQFTMYQVEIAGANGPTLYRMANSLVPYVYPDRLNIAKTKLTILTGGTQTTSQDVASPLPSDTQQAQRVTFPVGVSRQVITQYDTLRGGAWYTVSAYVHKSAGMGDLFLRVYNPATGAQLAKPASYTEGSAAPALGEGWKRIVAVFQTPANGGVLMRWEPQITQPQISEEEFAVAGHLLEEGIAPEDYFSWQSGNIDLWYRYGHNDASGGTFYYKDFARRSYILKQALDESAPTGVIVEYPEFGKIPYLDN